MVGVVAGPHPMQMALLSLTPPLTRYHAIWGDFSNSEALHSDANFLTWVSSSLCNSSHTLLDGLLAGFSEYLVKKKKKKLAKVRPQVGPVSCGVSGTQQYAVDGLTPHVHPQQTKNCSCLMGICLYSASSRSVLNENFLDRMVVSLCSQKRCLLSVASVASA